MPSARLLPALLLLTLCACPSNSRAPGVPVDITAENLEGYWSLSRVESGGGAAVHMPPFFLHFGATLAEYPGQSQLAEVLAGGQTFFGPYTLGADGAFVQGGQDTRGLLKGERLFSGTILSLTGDELRFQPTSGPRDVLVLKRVRGCGGQGTWWPSGGRVMGAAWGGDGALHLLLNNTLGLGDLTGRYAFVPPGRCALQTPAEVLVGDALGVAPDGTVRIIDVRGPDAQRPERGGVFVHEVPAEPWRRAGLNARVTQLSTTAGTSYARPAAEVAHRADGSALLFWGSAAGLHAWAGRDGAFTHEVLPVNANSGLNPQFVQVVPDGQGGFIVSGDHHWLRMRLRAGASAWERWEVPEHSTFGRPKVIAFDAGGRMVAAFGRPHLFAVGPNDKGMNQLVVAWREAGGAWSEPREAGVGEPWELRVREDGSLDLVGLFSDRLGSLWWGHLPADGQGWRQAYALGEYGLNGIPWQYTSYDNIYPFAAWGPEGAVFLAAEAGAWRRPRFEHEGGHLPSTRTRITFQADIPVRLRFPTLGLTCEATCDVVLPHHEVVPAVVEGGGDGRDFFTAPEHLAEGSPPAQLTGGVFPLSAPGHFALITQHSFNADLPGYGARGLAVRVRGRELFHVTQLQPGAGLRRVAGLAPGPGGGFYVAADHADGTHVVELDAALAPVRTHVIPALHPARDGSRGGAVRALSAGGAVVSVLPELHKPQLRFLGADLSPGPVVDLQGAQAFALTDTGAVGLRWHASEPRLELVPYTASGPGAPLRLSGSAFDPFAGTNGFAPVGDGWVLSQSTTGNNSPANYDRTRLVGLGPTGAERWSFEAGQAMLAWRVRGGDVVGIAYYRETLYFGSQRFELLTRADSNNVPVATGLLFRLDGATGALKEARRGFFHEPSLPSAFVPGPSGVLLVNAHTVDLTLTVVPWDEGKPLKRVDSTTLLVSPPGYCATPGVRCGQGGAFGLENGEGWTLQWDMGAPTKYDGVALDPARGNVVGGVFRPR